IFIVRQPYSVCVPVNHRVTLSVRAQGTGNLQYQWFTPDNEVFGGTLADLTIKATKSQLFVCRINDNYCNCVFSEWVKVKVLDIDKLHIAVNPKPQTVRPGENFTLRCVAFGIPTPQYQWYRNGQGLKGKTRDTLQVDGATAEHGGTYLCSVTNILQERWTEAVDVNVTDKVALLIGNLNYSQHPGLMAPVMDVHKLANLLRQLGFRVVSLLDLTRDEMLAAIERFIQLLNRGVYLFYYAGHGYECAGRNYLVAVDAPQPYRPENCVCVQRIMISMQQRQTALSVILLDACRKYKQHHIPSIIMPLKPSGNTVYGYACEDAEAFEVQDGGKSTGIFTKYLNKHILRSDKVTHVLERVSELGTDCLVTGRQAVEIKHTLKEPRSLTDPIRTTGHTQELRLRDACWRQANLPEKQCLRFPCGVEVEVSFSALFSNVLVIFATVKTISPQAQDCTVALSSTPPLEDIFSGSDHSEEMDSLLFTNSHSPDCTMRLCALQRLKSQSSLVIRVDLHYTHTDSKLRQTESQEVDTGKPLVASCRFYQRKAAADERHNGASAQSTGHVPSSKQTVAGHCRP
uniref:Mucosa-associated lymphoid tissue lymphoma translocation protein 1-like n=1 Tax=Cynoglossus semilaevis TaxID=244447 RepID=A0A3P8W5W7_CYNSE